MDNKENLYKYSVLMSVYNKENEEYLNKSMESMFNQTIKTDDFVLICDGPLTDKLDEVISNYKEKYPDVLNVVRLKESVKLGKALQIGVSYCKNDIIARMDSDDISRKDRCEKELEILRNNDISIVGTNIKEFSEDDKNIATYRIVPEKNEEIKKFSKKRNPFNHSTVMFRKKDVLDSENYRDLPYLQDYYLWIDMLSKGKKGYNIQEPLLKMRVSNEFYKRRSGKEYYKIQKDLFKYMKEIKYISNLQYINSIIIRYIFSIMPNNIRKTMFKVILRNRVSY